MFAIAAFFLLPGTILYINQAFPSEEPMMAARHAFL
jgi:hypothetical protein